MLITHSAALCISSAADCEALACIISAASMKLAFCHASRSNPARIPDVWGCTLCVAASFACLLKAGQQKSLLVQIAANLPGLLMSGLAIWTTSIYQIWAGSKQKEYQVRLFTCSQCTTRCACCSEMVNALHKQMLVSQFATWRVQ